MPKKLQRKLGKKLRPRRIRLGAKGSLAKQDSTRTKIKANARNEAKELRVRVSVQETLPPRSRVRRRKKTVRTREKEPRKSTRASLTRQVSVVWVAGRSRTMTTTENATRIAGTCARKALGCE